MRVKGEEIHFLRDGFIHDRHLMRVADFHWMSDDARSSAQMFPCICECVFITEDGFYSIIAMNETICGYF